MSSLNENLTPAQLRKQRDAVLEVEYAKQQQIRDEKYIAEAERYKQYVSMSNIAVDDGLDLKIIFKSPFFIIMVCIIFFEKYIFNHIENIYLHSHLAQQLLQFLYSILPIDHVIAPLKPKGFSVQSDAYLLYQYFMRFIIIGKVICLFVWLNTLRQNRIFRRFVITPLTVVRPLSIKDNIMESGRTVIQKQLIQKNRKYRSVWERWIWLFLICILAALSLLAGVIEPDTLYPARLTFIFSFFITIAIHGLLDAYRFIRINYVKGV